MELRLVSYPHCVSRDDTYTQRFREELREDAERILWTTLAALRGDAGAGATDDRDPKVCIVLAGNGNGDVRYCVHTGSENPGVRDVLRTGLRHFEFAETPAKTSHDHAAAAMLLGRRVFEIDTAIRRRTAVSGTRSLPAGVEWPANLAAVHPYVSSMRLQGRQEHWRQLARVLAEVHAPCSLVCTIRQARRVDIDRAGLENSVKFLDECLSPTFSLNSKDEYFATYRSLLADPEVLWLTWEVYGNAAERVALALAQDTDPRGWATVPAGPAPRQIRKQLAHLWSLPDAAQILCPPFSMGDPVPGMPVHRVLPFFLPAIEPRRRPEPEVQIGLLSDGNPLAVAADDFKRGLSLFGVPRAGKSVTARHIVRQLADCGVRILVVDPAGRDWEPFMRQMGGQVFGFSPGMTPFGFNPFLPIGDTTIRDQALLLAQVLAMAWPTNEFGLMALQALIKDVYWIKANKGAPSDDEGVRAQLTREQVEGRRAAEFADPDLRATLPTIDDLFRWHKSIFEAFAHGYELSEWLQIQGRQREGKAVPIRRLGMHSSDILPSMLRRVAGLRGGPLHRIFTPPADDPYRTFDGLLGNNALLQLTSLGSTGEAAAISALVLSMVHRKRLSEGEHPRLRHLLVVEEAHNVVPAQGPATARDLVADPHHENADAACHILLECPKYGQGVALIDQRPTALRAEALSAISIVLTHRLISGGEKQAIGDATALDQAQVDSLGALEIGQGVACIDGQSALFRTPAPGGVSFDPLSEDGASVRPPSTNEEILKP